MNDDVSARALAFKPRLGANQGYLSSSEIASFVNETAQRLPRGFTRVEQIGTTVQKRPIVALCVGACDSNATVPQALFTGMHHSREVRACCCFVCVNLELELTLTLIRSLGRMRLTAYSQSQ